MLQHKTTCQCGRGKVSAYDGKCGHCRNRKEKLVHQRMLKGWSRESAELGWLNKDERGKLCG